MSEASELLATLRDVVEPPPPAGVPPALVLANVALAVLLVALLLLRYRRRRRAWLDAALARVRAARALAPDAALLELAALLRRVMRHRHGTRVDALQGEAWLVCLDETFGDDWFSRGEGRAFGDALYAPHTARDADVGRLGREIARRLKRLRPVSRGETGGVPSTAREPSPARVDDTPSVRDATGATGATDTIDTTDTRDETATVGVPPPPVGTGSR